MLAITHGGTSFRAISSESELLPNEVAFLGEFLWEDAFSPGMVWDAGLGNIRPKNTAEILVAAKSKRITANRSECSSRIFDRYPAGRQLSALAGMYDSANVAAMHEWIAANIAAENTAADEIEAATTVAAVEAVTVAWPV